MIYSFWKLFLVVLRLLLTVIVTIGAVCNNQTYETLMFFSETLDFVLTFRNQTFK